MTDFSDVLGDRGSAILGQTLASLEQGTSAWETLLASLLREALDKHGLEGLPLVKQLVMAVFSKEKPDIDWLSARSASDAVARLQLLEARDQTETLRWFSRLGHALVAAGGGVGLGILKGLL